MGTRFNHYNAATGEMCFSNALLSLKRGNRIARKSWGGRCYLTIEGNLIRSVYSIEIRQPFNINSQDLLALDWVEVI